MRNKVSNVLWGMLFIVAGIGFAGNAFNLWNFELFFDGWWTLFIIIPSVISIIQSGFNHSSVIGLIVGVLLFISCRPGMDKYAGKLIMPTILIYIGIRIMFRNTFKHTFKHNRMGFTNNQGSGVHIDNENGDNTEYVAIFSGNKVHIYNEEFRGATLTAAFGGLELDLRDAIIDHDIKINATATFGGINIFVPRHVVVKVNNVPIFGGVSNKANKYAEPGAPIIYINSTCMFGGVEIR